jgi:hypothetical protein
LVAAVVVVAEAKVVEVVLVDTALLLELPVEAHLLRLH